MIKITGLLKLYFSRNGWERKPDYRGKECQDMNEHDLQMTLEECVRAKRPECKTPDIEYIEFICGNHEICKANQQNYQKKRLALEMAKIRLLKEYYIGKSIRAIRMATSAYIILKLLYI